MTIQQFAIAVAGLELLTGLALSFVIVLTDPNRHPPKPQPAPEPEQTGDHRP